MLDLGTVKVADFPFEGKVVEVDSNTVINDAFQLLNKNNILSCPVFDKKAGKYLGFFDIVEAMSLLYTLDAVLDSIPTSLMKENPEKALEESKESLGSGSPVSILFEDDSINMFPVVPWQPVSLEDTLDTVIKRLASGLRRVPVVDGKGKVVKIISQSSVTKALSEWLDGQKKAGKELPGLFTKTPANLDLGIGKVVSIKEDEPTREAFRKILETGYSAVAVLDETDALFTCISTKDVRHFDTVEEAALQRVLANKKEEADKHPETSKSPDPKVLNAHVAFFDLSASDFVSFIRQGQLGKDRPSVVCTEPSSTIDSIVAKLATTRMHRVFLCDKNRTPVGVVSVSDICKLLAETVK